MYKQKYLKYKKKYLELKTTAHKQSGGVIDPNFNIGDVVIGKVDNWEGTGPEIDAQNSVFGIVYEKENNGTVRIFVDKYGGDNTLINNTTSPVQYQKWQVTNLKTAQEVANTFGAWWWTQPHTQNVRTLLNLQQPQQ